MTREFPDELLSAFLDNELTEAERAQVEQHLASSPPDRQLLAELKSLRGDMAALPSVAVSPDFADRVVRAAVAEAKKLDATPAASPVHPKSQRPARRWMVPAALAGAAALAALALLVIQPWRQANIPVVVVPVNPGRPGPQIAAIANPFLNSLREAAPGEGEAVVLRLRVDKDSPLAAALDAALGSAGIASLAADAATSATPWQDAYRRSLEAKYGVASGTPSEALLNSTVAAAEAIFVEAPLERLDGVFSALSAGVKQPLELSPIGKLALAGRATSRDPGAEGEFGSGRPIVNRQPFAQKLNASLFRLEKKLAQAAATIAPAQASGKLPKAEELVRVLILVETQ